MKSIFQTKTFWANLITGVALVLALPELHVLLGEHAMRFVVLGQAVLNIGLRFLATQPVSFSGR